MVSPAKFQDICNDICARLTRDEYDRDAFHLLHSSCFMLSCAWMGLDPKAARKKIRRIAARRRMANESKSRGDGVSLCAGALTSSVPSSLPAFGGPTSAS